MGNDKLYAGHIVRRLRRVQGGTQAALAEKLGISASYLNFIENNQRPLSAPLLLRLAEIFDVDPRAFRVAAPGGGAAAMARRLADPLFAGLSVGAEELDAWLTAAPGTADAFALLFDRAPPDAVPDAAPRVAAPAPPVHEPAHGLQLTPPLYLPDLDEAAESLAESLMRGGADLPTALTQRLAERHRLAVLVTPADALEGEAQQLDYAARALRLSEFLSPAQRTFAVATLIGQLEARGAIDAAARAAGAGDRATERALRRDYAQYYAAALMLPYGRFFRACAEGQYDVALLARRFQADVEQVARRMTTLHRPGLRGLPFALFCVTRAGRVSYAIGAAGAAGLAAALPCPLWEIHNMAGRSDESATQMVRLDDESHWFTRNIGVKRGHSGGVFDYALSLALPLERAGGMPGAEAFLVAGAVAGAVAIGPRCPLCRATRAP